MFALQLLGQFIAFICVRQCVDDAISPFLFQTDYFIPFMQIALFNN
jgi:hypothetical protein